MERSAHALNSFLPFPELPIRHFRKLTIMLKDLPGLPDLFLMLLYIIHLMIMLVPHCSISSAVLNKQCVLQPTSLATQALHSCQIVVW